MDGIILVFKNKGLTSFQIVKEVKRILNIKKVGHAGTLDPMAEGLLILLLGKATKLFSKFLKLKKEYIFKVVFGKATETKDSEGKIIAEKRNFILKEENILKVIPFFIGEIDQRPPLFSAVKIKGIPAYKIARKKGKVDLPKRKVKIYNLKFLDFKKDKHEAEFLAEVSSGTYIRSLAEDIGKKLNLPAYTSYILRTKIGPFSLKKSYKISEIQKLKEKTIISLEELITFISDN